MNEMTDESDKTEHEDPVEDTTPTAADLGITTDQPRTHAEAVTKLADAMLRYALWPAVATVVVGIVIASLLYGARGGVAALVGGIVAFGSSLATWWLMRRTAGMNPMMVMAGALGGFVGKMIVLLLVLMVLREISWLHTRSLAYTMLAVVIVWAAMDTVAFRRTKLPTLIVDADDR
jgi:ATP synthase protein I